MRGRLSSAERAAMRRRDIAAIHAMAAKLGMDTADRNPASEYRSMLKAVGGAESTTEMGPDALGRVRRHLLRATGSAGAQGSMSAREFIELLWRQLGEAGKLDDPSPGGLSKFIHRLCGVHLASALTGAQAARVIEALKAWRARDDAR